MTTWFIGFFVLFFISMIGLFFGMGPFMARLQSGQQADAKASRPYRTQAPAPKRS